MRITRTTMKKATAAITEIVASRIKVVPTRIILVPRKYFKKENAKFAKL